MRGSRNLISAAGSNATPSRTITRDHDVVVAERRGDADGRALGDVGMFGHQRLDLERRDVLAAAADRVAHPVDEVVPAVAVDPERVAGVEPAVAPRLGRLLRHLVVARVERPRLGGAHDHLPDLAGVDRLVVLVDDAHLGPRVVEAFPSAVRPRAVLPARGHGHADLGLPVAGGDPDAEATLEAGDLGDHRAEDHVAQRVVGVVGPHAARRTAARSSGPTSAAVVQPVARTSSQKLGRAEAVADHEPAAAHERVVEGRAAGVVEQRHRANRARRRARACRREPTTRTGTRRPTA